MSCRLNNDTSSFEIEDIPVPLKEVKPEEASKLESVVLEFIQRENITKQNFSRFRIEMQRKHHISFNNSQLRYVYKTMIARKMIQENKNLESIVKAKGVRELSGVTVFTILTSPFPETGEFVENFVLGGEYDYTKVNLLTGEKRQDFSCPYNCYYCPDESVKNGAEADMPRSYLRDEPAVARAYQNKFDTVDQIRDRGRSYVVNGIDIDKVEVIVEGGTYTSYPKNYRIQCMRDIFYAFNTLFDDDYRTSPRPRLSLQEEIKINEKGHVRVIGITVETRPDCIDPEHLVEFRECGITRVQIGIQHTDDRILKKINRQSTTQDAIRAIKRMKDSCFKIDCHLMPDLPYSSYEKDIEMFDRINTDPQLDVDQLKIYPCATVPYTVIKKWYEERRYVPYAEKKIEVTINGTVRKSTPLIEALIHYKKNVPKHRRNNRIVRDIPTSYIVGGYDKPNLRQLVQDEMKFRGLVCKCIRCREVRDQKTDLNQARLDVEEYPASGGTEYFISYESPDAKVLYGFVRLRLSPYAGEEAFPELRGCALIRELHVYGKMRVVGSKDKNNNNNKNKNNKNKKNKKNNSANSNDNNDNSNDNNANSNDNNDNSNTNSNDNNNDNSNNKKQEEDGTIQHFGFGSKLLQAAEKIAYQRSYRKAAVIAGVGVRDYYRRKGYRDEGYFLIKQLDEEVLKCSGVNVGDAFGMEEDKNINNNKRLWWFRGERNRRSWWWTLLMAATVGTIVGTALWWSAYH